MSLLVGCGHCWDPHFHFLSAWSDWFVWPEMAPPLHLLWSLCSWIWPFIVLHVFINVKLQNCFELVTSGLNIHGSSKGQSWVRQISFGLRQGTKVISANHIWTLMTQKFKRTEFSWASNTQTLIALGFDIDNNIESQWAKLSQTDYFWTLIA